MKYTRTEADAVIEVKGCTTCPHMVQGAADKAGFMCCTKSVPGANVKLVKRNKKLTSQWTGAYHASCPLPSDPKMVPENPKVEKVH